MNSDEFKNVLSHLAHDSNVEKAERFNRLIILLRNYLAKVFTLETYEVSLFMKDERDFVEFLLPEKMRRVSNIFPLRKSKVTRRVFTRGIPVLSNAAAEVDRFDTYERYRDTPKASLPIQKFMALPIIHEDSTFGALWINRRAKTMDQAGADFNEQDQQTAMEILSIAAPFLYALKPDKYC